MLTLVKPNGAITHRPRTVDKIAIRRRVCRESYYDFVQEFWGELVPDPPVWNWHIRILCNALQKQMERVFKMLPKEYDILVNVPPGTSKSTIFSIMALPWAWTRMPHLRMINGCYEADLALEFGNKTRSIIKGDLYRETFPEIEVDESQDAKGFFANTRKGERRATSTGANITGKHAHLIMLDDLINPLGVKSEQIITTCKDWFTTTIPSRCVNLAITPINLIMQRLSVEDPAGIRLQRFEDGFGTPLKWYCFPAELSEIINPKIFANKYRNGLLDPVRLPKQILEDKKEEFGKFAYAGQYEQRPIPSTGGMFQVDKFVMMKQAPPPAAFAAVIRWWDKAATAGGGDYTAGGLMGRLKDQKAVPRYIILDLQHEQWDTFTREKMIKQSSLSDEVFYKRIYKVGMEQEPGSAGKDSAQSSIINLDGFTVIVEKSTGPKVERADPFSTQVNAGNVGMVVGRWNRKLIDQLKVFDRTSKKDDIVDSLSGGYKHLAKKKAKVGAGGF